jgi:cytochrome c-type biogenesis protein CcmE
MPVKPAGQNRVGGFVITGSLRSPDTTTVKFRLSDETTDLQVKFAGALRDLFREGGVLSLKAQRHWRGGSRTP